MEATHSGGLIGLVSRFSRSASVAARSGMNPDAWALFFVGISAVCTIAKHAGIDLPWYAQATALCLGVAALMFEGSSVRGFMHAFWEARAGGMVLNGVLWVFAFGFAMFNWLGTAGENEAEKTNLHKAAAFKTQDARGALQSAAQAVLEARTKVQGLRKEVSENVPVIDGVQILTVEQADAVIATAMGNKKFWGLSEGCKEAKGPNARAFCDKYGKALSARSWAQNRILKLEELKIAEADVKAAEKTHAEAQSVAGDTKIVSAGTRSDLFVLTDWAGFSERQAEQAASVFSIMVMSIFWSFGWARFELPALKAMGPRRKFDLIGRTYRGIYHAAYGKEAPAKPATYISVEDPHGRAALDLATRIQNGAAEYVRRSSPLGA